jgi:hypothetical protein
VRGLRAAEFGWDATFEALVARIVADYASDHDPTREAAWIAEADGQRVGCIFCVAADDNTAQLRLRTAPPRTRLTLRSIDGTQKRAPNDHLLANPHAPYRHFCTRGARHTERRFWAVRKALVGCRYVRD